MMTGLLLALFALFQTAMWMQAEAITPTYPPVFPVFPYLYSIPENYGNNLSIYENVSINAAAPIQAVDAEGFRVTYSIPLYSVNSDKFCMKDNTSGLIYVCRGVILDREVLTPNSFVASLQLTVTASNGAFTAATTVYVYLIDVNDNRPQLTNLPATISLSELTPSGTPVFTVTATDGDQTFYRTYSIINSSAFFITPTTGVITLNTSFDYNTQTSYNLIISLKDDLNDSFALTSTSSLIVMVTPVSRRPPVFISTNYTTSVFENSTNGTDVIQVFAYDADRGINDVIIYSIISGNNALTIANITSPSFSIDSTSGEISVLVTRLKWEVYSVYNLVVQGTKRNSPLLTSTTMVTITVIDDMSDNMPMFQYPSYQATVSETSAVGVQVLTVSAVDPAVRNNIKFFYAIVNTSVPFSIDQSGVLRVNGSIDYAQAMQYSFQIIAVEYEVPIEIRKTATALVIITVMQLNRHAPVFDNATYSVSLYEARLYPTALTVRATDTDLSTFGVVSYLIINSDNGHFQINSTSGSISVIAPLNYTLNKTHTLLIQATDGAPSQPRTGQCTVVIRVLAIISLPPLFVNPAPNVSIPETSPPGTLLYTFQYMDPNPVVPPAVLVLTILTGNELSLFKLNGSSLHTNASFNYDVINNYTLVLLLNNSVYTSTITFQVLLIHVNKFSPVFVNSTYYFEVSESAPSRTSVGTIRATDDDTQLFGLVKYSLSGPGSNNFTVNMTTGVIETSSLLNRLATPSYTFLGVATDSDPNHTTRRSSTVNITIKVTNDNNHPPMFNVPQVVYNVIENIAILLDQSGLPLMVTATSLNMGTRAEITYQLISGNTASLFLLDNSTGYLSRNPSMVIDREETQQYNLTILAWITALPSLNSSVMVTINIVDTNDHTPEFSSSNYSITLSEDASLGFIYQFNATDLDIGTNAQLNFSIVTSISTFKSSSFFVTSNGAMNLTAALDREAFAGPYGITVMVTDGGVPPLHSTTLMVVYITDVNDNAPLFPLDVYSIQLNPSVNSTYITTVTAFDNDLAGTPNSNVTYRIASVNGSMGNFLIDKMTGAITSSSPLRSQDSYIISVVASDQGTPSLSSNTTVAVTVAAIYDATPNFSMPGYVFSVTEDTSVNTRLEGIRASAGVGVSVVYSTDSDFMVPFVIDPVTAELVLVSQLSYGEDDEYKLTVVAQNRDYPSKRSACNVTIEVLQVNRHSPMFSSSNYITSVLEGSPENTPVIKVIATDLDTGVFGVVTYSISGSNAFSINESTGQLSTLMLINRSYLVYKLNLTAMDGGSPPRLSVAVATITVITTNNYAPVFSSAVYTGSIREATPPGYTVVIVSAMDADFGSNAVVRYSINDTTNFVIDTIYGVVTSNATFHYEVQSHYIINVTAYDLGTPSMSNSTVITVEFLPLNLHPPVFTSIPPPRTIREDVPVNYSVITLVATDADSGSNALLSFNLANDLGYFSINSNGTIIVTAPMDKEAISSFNLTVIASDCGSPQRSSTVTYVPISILDINPLPSFTQAVYVVPVTYPNDVNITMKATDLDLGTNTNITFNISEGDTSVFGIRVNTGPTITVYNTQPLTQPAYSLRINAFNVYQIQNQSSAIISIVVSGITATASLIPFFGVTTFTQTITEASPIGTFLYPTLYAVDNTSSSITYSLGGCVSPFSVDVTTGMIELIDILDREVTGSYSCTLMASNGFGSTSVSLTIVVLDSNDNTPVFSSTLYLVNVKESTRAGKSIGRVVALDADQTSSVTYMILSGDDIMAPKFSLIPSTGVILTTNTPLNRTLKASYTLTVQASDSVNQATAVVYVTVEDQNDHTPVFVGAPYVSNVLETALIVATLQATDADAGLNAVIKFSIDLGNTTIFQIDENSGLITAHPNMLSYGNQAIYVLVVLAVDQAVDVCERRTAATTVTINLLPFNHHRPVFSQDTYSITIFENITVGQVVLSVTATDADFGVSGEFTYRTNQNLSSSSFSINNLTGSVMSTAALNREVQNTHLLIIEAVDKGTPPLTGTAAVVITVQDVNDNSPYFSISYYFVSIGEAAPIGATVISVQASDVDLDTVLTYSISGDSYPYGFFKINPYTGLIQTARRLDNEASSLVTLTVEASDGLNSGTTLVQISVTNGNDKPPRFLQSNYICAIPENSPAGTRVSVLLYDGNHSRIVAMDPDVPSTTVIYQLAGNVLNYFYMNQTTGVIFVKQGVVLDRESRHGYWINGSVVATDSNGLGLSSMAQLSVQISDVIEHPPVFSEPLGYSLALWENTPLQTVSNQIRATSVDIQSIGYSIIGTSPWPLTSSLLAIDSLSGLLNLTGAVNREMFPFSNQSLLARGNVIPALFTTASLQVSVLDTNDNPPLFNSTVYTVVVMENISVGAAVLQVSAEDFDLGYGGVVVYSIVSSDGPFFINPTTGLMSTTDRLTYKVRRVYTITVQACDLGSPVMCSSTLASVQVVSGNDHAPTFTYPTYQLSIPSDLAQNSSVIRPVAMDTDIGAAGQITYSILTSSTDLIRVSDPASGLIVLSRAIDNSEVGSTFTFRLVAVDGGAVPLTGTSTLTITIFNVSTMTPIFQSVFYEASVSENLGQVMVVNFSTNNTMATYYLPSDLTNVFNLNWTSQDIVTVTTLVTLDREQVEEYNLIITENTSGVAAVTIRVLDVNDNYPTFLQPLYSFSLMEGMGPSMVGAVAAFDLDAGNNGTVIYTLQLASNPNGTFVINETTGRLTTTGPLNREEVAFHNLTVIGMDRGTPFNLSTLVTVLVSVLDVNDNPPIFSQASYVTSIFDNAPIGSSVLRVVASDMDVGTNAQIWYSILSGSNGQFTIDGATGLITTNTTLRYVSNSVYAIIISATDRGMPALSTNVTVTVQLNDSNDCTPAFLSNVTSLISISEGPTSVHWNEFLGPYVVDCDPGLAGISYSILAGNTLSWFSINSTSGVIATTMPLDRENISSFLLTLQVKDSFPPSLVLSSQLEISVVVMDINDNPPVFPVSVYYVTVYEDTPAGQSILTVAATDRDASSNAAVNYSLAGQSTFVSVTPTGSIIAKALNRGKFNVTVVATDGGIPQMNSTAVVSVTVLGVNRNSPVFTNVMISPRTSVSINENASISDVVFVVMATDRDSGLNGQITFLFGLGNEDEKFSIHSLTGVISVAARLSYRTLYYQLTVIAMDMGTPPRSTSATLTVQIQPVVNYFPPVFGLASYTATLVETTPSNSSVISMPATDRDLSGTPGASITYLLVGPNSDYFRIDDSGNVYTNKSLNQRLISSFLLEAVAINSHASPVLFSSVNLMVTVTTAINNDPMFLQTSYAISIPELTPAGTTVLTLLATDIDPPGTPKALISYSFQSPSNMFTLRPSGDVVLSGTLDWSTATFYKLTVCASDAGTPSAITCVPLNVTILDQNTYPPVFNYQSYSVYVYENVSTFPWPLSVNLSYTDRDSVNNSLSAYFIASINGQHIYDNTFSLNQWTGALVLNERVEVVRIRQYRIEVIVVNVRMGRGPRCTLPAPCKFQNSIIITVNVIDVNDHSPVFNSSIFYLYVSNEIAVGTAITSLRATDLDDGIFGQNGITYLFNGTTARIDPFRIETLSGVVYTSALLKSYDGVTFSLPVVAKDGGTPPNTNSTSLSILVLSNTKRLSATFQCDIQTLRTYQAIIVSTLNKAVPGYNVTVEAINPFIDLSTGELVLTKTELVFHVYDVQNKTYTDYLLYYDLLGMLNSDNVSSALDTILSETIPANCSVQSVQPLSQTVPFTPGRNYTDVVTVTVTVPTLPVALPAHIDIQILIVMVFCGVLALGALILTLLSFYQRYAALHDARTKLLADVFYGNQGTTMVENLQLQNLHLDELSSNTQIQRDNPIFVHPYEDWIGIADPTKASIGGESSATKQLDNPLYEEQELRMDMFSQDSDEDGEVDEAELLAAALQDDDDNEDNTVTTI